MQYLTPNEKEQLLRAVYSEKGKHRKRNIAIFEVGLYCALRVSEIKGLKVNCYDSNRKTIFCYRLKGSRANTIKIVDLHVVKALEDYLEERAERGIESSYLFISQKGNPISRQRMDAMIKKYAARERIFTMMPPTLPGQTAAITIRARGIQRTSTSTCKDRRWYWLHMRGLSHRSCG